ncbi:hypothetical protein GOODEAATRI_019455 [Goodea atripinnis]|uniref:Uncharacterized protein n=1 Tax=Goodea atripinnis TaxID=208336 RepID=A0ABV0P667_9TELE
MFYTKPAHPCLCEPCFCALVSSHVGTGNISHNVKSMKKTTMQQNVHTTQSAVFLAIPKPRLLQSTVKKRDMIRHSRKRISAALESSGSLHLDADALLWKPIFRGYYPATFGYTSSPKQQNEMWRNPSSCHSALQMPGNKPFV